MDTWTKPELKALALGGLALGGHLPGITEDGHVHGNSHIHRNPDTPNGVIEGGYAAPFSA